jgi:hypothetical protein
VKTGLIVTLLCYWGALAFAFWCDWRIAVAIALYSAIVGAADQVKRMLK